MEARRYGIQLDSVSDRQIALFQQSISEARRKKAERYRFYDDAKRFILGEMIVRYAISDFWGDPAEPLAFEVLEYGKPVVKGHDEFQFSLSHSGQWVVCAVSEKAVGIDVEKKDPRHLNVARSFFSQYENDRILSYEKESERADEFFRIWTLKESYLKAIGLGLHKGLDTFEFHLENDREVLYNEGRKEPFACYSELLDARHAAALCCNPECDVSPMVLLNGDSLEAFEKARGKISPADL